MGTTKTSWQAIEGYFGTCQNLVLAPRLSIVLPEENIECKYWRFVMKHRKAVEILTIVFVLSLITAVPVLADKPECRNIPYDFIHSHSIEFSLGDWSLGSHTYQMRITIGDLTTLELDPVTFLVTEDAALYSGQVHDQQLVPETNLGSINCQNV
jgi:hypothetical protein